MRDVKQNIRLFLTTVHIASKERGSGGQGHFQPQLHTCKDVKDGFISCLYNKWIHFGPCLLQRLIVWKKAKWPHL